MTALSDYAELKMLDHVLGTTSWTMPSALYAALHTADPTDAGSGTELSTDGYARQTITFGAAGSGAAANSSVEAFLAAGGDWGLVTHVGLRDAVSAGNLLLHGAWSPARTINDGDTFAIAVGDIIVSFPNSGSAKWSTYAMNKMLDHILRVGSFTMPSAIYLGLYTAAPTVAGGGTEVSGNGYARDDVTFAAASAGSKASNNAQAFAASGGNWGTVTHWGLFDASSAGNLLCFGPLSTPRVINDGDGLTVASGGIVATMS